MTFNTVKIYLIIIRSEIKFECVHDDISTIFITLSSPIYTNLIRFIIP